MDFSLSSEEQDVRATIRSFVAKELMPLEDDVLRREGRGEHGLPRDILRELQAKARKAGYWGLGTPEEYGGMDLSAVMQSVISTELGRTFVPFEFGGYADNILFAGTPEQQAQYLVPTLEGERVSCFALTEPGTGSDATSIKLTAKEDGGDWVLTGEKTFISFGHQADFAIVFAVTDPELRSRGGITAFLVDRDRGWTSSPIKTMGEHKVASLYFDNVRVPRTSVLGEVGYGFALAMRWIGRGRYLIPSRALGSAERLIEMAVRHANSRVAFGQPIGSNQAIQWMIADCALALEQARWITLYAAWRLDQGLDNRLAGSMAKLGGGLMANDVVDKVLQVHGAMGYSRELPVERWYRELRVARIYEGTDEIQRRTIAREVLGGRYVPGHHVTGTEPARS
jgi:alkylation response protein AidB-like acyl-CoA dehydrogenase